jgi:hypothetical protein
MMEITLYSALLVMVSSLLVVVQRYRPSCWFYKTDERECVRCDRLREQIHKTVTHPSRQIIVVVLVVVTSLAFVASGTAVAVGGETQPTNLSGQPGQPQAGANTTQQNASRENATVELDNTNNTTVRTVVVSTVQLPEGGFVAIHGPEFAEQGILDGSQITVSRYLKPGTHHNVTVPVKRGVPGAYTNSSRINLTRTNLSAIVYRDTNNNSHYDFVGSLGQNDTPYQRGNVPIHDTETVVFERNVQYVKEHAQGEPATIQFNDQQVRHVNEASILVVENVTLPKGGFVVIHDSRYLPPTRDPLNSAIGLSQYLKPGSHQNVTIELLNSSVTETQTLIAVPYLDTNGNRRYDYVTSGGEDDYQYIKRQNGSSIVPNDTATVRVPGSSQTTAASTQTPRTTTSDPSAKNATGRAGGKSSEGGFFAGFSLLQIILGGVFVLVIGLILRRRIGGRRRRF